MQSIKNYLNKKKLTDDQFKKKYKHLFDYKDETNTYCVKCIMRKAHSTDVCVSKKIGYINGHQCIQAKPKEDFVDITSHKPTKIKHTIKFSCDNDDEIINHVATKKQIYLWGGYGKGKTQFLKYLRERQGGLLILTAKMHDMLIEEIKWEKATHEPKKSIKKKMLEAEHLYLDDIGNENMSDFVQEALQIIINERYEKKQPTYVTSNYSLPALYKVWTKKIGEVKAGQLISRLSSFGEFEIKGKNWRK